ncbi:bifunctional diguanylate cyclase/phosphodiesterase [Thiomonas bhubaneswarensis]|uniref:Diguanylate cyclase (GGDEF) domain n=1 Tax=Thiomonas bhubaneswarensis TaxID=339866 RepID=A0A0K6I4V2_9BURK|nr:EAL domain-containing protein [Thiomonas bhubaneswarensis]CUA98150.1 diguanylate cyclase (GGDEF) domain [Thiomonas bhubaneswarensis]
MRRRLRRGYWGLVALTVLFGAWLAWLNWQRQGEMLHSTLRVETAFLADAATSYFERYESVMSALGNDLLSRPELLATPDQLTPLLQRYRALLGPEQALAINLSRPDGQMFASTVVSKEKLPNLAAHHDIWSGIEQATRMKSLEVGKAVYGPMLHRWVIPLRMMVKDAAGRPVVLIAVPVELNEFLDRWRRSVAAAQHTMPGMSMALIRSDGYLLARWPTPQTPDLQRFYGTRRQGALAAATRDAPQAPSGLFDGKVDSDGTPRTGAWVRLPKYGVVVTMTVPKAVLWRDFWRAYWPALSILALWTGLLTLTYRLVARQTERESAQLRDRAEIMYRLANQDSLTGLLNRRGMGEHLQRAHDRAQQDGIGYALVLFDLDHFKLINDGFGHAAGDAVLQQVAHLLQTRVRKEDHVARWGGEEFLVLLPDSTLETARAAAEKMRDLIAHTRMSVGGAELRLTASFGVSAWEPAARLTIAELLGQCDSALYNAKAGGRNRVRQFEGKSAQDYLRGFTLKRAIEYDRIRAAYQPLVSLADGKVVGYEALARLVGEDGEVIPAGQFIDVANRLRLEHRIDARVSKQVMAHCSQRIEATGAPMKYMINCSADFLSRPEDVQQLLDRAQHYCESCAVDMTGREKPMVIEITERQLIGDAEAVRKLVQPLIDFGFQLAVDDFGSGYSSYLYVLKLPVKYLKIEAELVREAAHSPRAQAMVRSINSMAHELGILTIAEGIEDQATAEAMRHIGVDWGQGYYWGRPEISD